MIGELRPAEIGGMKAGRNYLAHADGKADGPHCVSRRVAADETVRVSDGNSATYAQRLRSIREIIQAAIDNRVLSEYKQLKKRDHRLLLQICVSRYRAQPTRHARRAGVGRYYGDCGDFPQ